MRTDIVQLLADISDALPDETTALQARRVASHFVDKMATDRREEAIIAEAVDFLYASEYRPARFVAAAPGTPVVPADGSAVAALVPRRPGAGWLAPAVACLAATAVAVASILAASILAADSGGGAASVDAAGPECPVAVAAEAEPTAGEGADRVEVPGDERVRAPERADHVAERPARKPRRRRSVFKRIEGATDSGEAAAAVAEVAALEVDEQASGLAERGRAWRTVNPGLGTRRRGVSGVAVAHLAEPAEVVKPVAPVTVPPRAVRRISGRVPTLTAAVPGEMGETISVKLCIDRDGAVSRVEVLSASPPAVKEQLESALRTWRYRPVVVAGRAVPACFAHAFTVNVRPGEIDRTAHLPDIHN